MTASLAVLQHYSVFLAALYSLAHIEGEVDVLLLGEQQNEKVITRLTLFDGRIQTDLLRHNKFECSKKLCRNTTEVITCAFMKASKEYYRNQITTKNICL